MDNLLRPNGGLRVVKHSEESCDLFSGFLSPFQKNGQEKRPYLTCACNLGHNGKGCPSKSSLPSSEFLTFYRNRRSLNLGLKEPEGQVLCHGSLSPNWRRPYFSRRKSHITRKVLKNVFSQLQNHTLLLLLCSKKEKVYERSFSFGYVFYLFIRVENTTEC